MTFNLNILKVLSMKKIFLLFVLSSSLSFLTANNSSYYSFSVHIEPHQTTNNQAWEQSVSLVNTLREQFNPEEQEPITDEQMFLAYIHHAISIIHKILALNDNSQLDIGTKISYELLQMPKTGLVLAFEYMPDTTTCPQKNCDQIHALMGQLSVYNAQENKEQLFNNLSLLESVFELTYGQAAIQVIVNEDIP